VDLALAGVEGLHGPTKYISLAESGAVLDPHIICRDLGDCPTGDAAPTSFGTRGSQVQILPLRPAFLALESVTGNDMGNETLAPCSPAQPDAPYAPALAGYASHAPAQLIVSASMI
jgi:hypothetical protein